MRITELTNITKPPSTDRTRSFIDQVVTESPLLRNLNNFGLGATNHNYRPSAGTQQLASRAKGGNFSPEDLDQAALLAASLKIHGFSLDYDHSYQADHDLGIGVDIDPWLEAELQNRGIDTSEEIERLIIAGDGQGDNIEGIHSILDGSTNLPGLGITGVIDAAPSSNSLDLGDEANWEQFMEDFRKWQADMKGADMVICNESMAARLTSISRKLNSDGETRDLFGVEIDTINRLPIVAVDDTVITNTEPDNAGTANNDTTSILLAKNRVGHWTIRSNSGLATWDVGELPDKQSNRWKFEVRGFNEVRTKRSIRRVRALKL